MHPTDFVQVQDHAVSTRLEIDRVSPNEQKKRRMYKEFLIFDYPNLEFE